MVPSEASTDKKEVIDKTRRCGIRFLSVRQSKMNSHAGFRASGRVSNRNVKEVREPPNR